VCDRRRVVLTGIGVVSCLGATFGELASGLVEGKSGVRALTRFDATRFPGSLAAEVRDGSFAAAEGPYSYEIRRAGRFVQYAVAAAESAVADLGMPWRELPPDRAGVYLGVSTGGLDEMEAAVLRQEQRGPGKISPYQITSMLPNMAAGLIAMRLGCSGPHYTFNAACAGGTQAIGEAMHGIRAGRLVSALVCGADGVLTPIAYSSFGAMRMLAASADVESVPRPFDESSNGIVLGEGAAAFVLEDREHAEARGATIYAELLGYAATTGGARVALQSKDDVWRCMEATLEDARLRAAEVDAIYAQAAGIRQGDECELEAIEAAFPPDRMRPAILSIKGHIGHTFAASGPFNVAGAVAALRSGKLPKTRNLRAPLARFAHMNFGPDYRVPRPRNILINTYGFGGLNASLCVAGARPTLQS